MLGKTSYKEVADYITEEVARKMKEQGDGEGVIVY